MQQDDGEDKKLQQIEDKLEEFSNEFGAGFAAYDLHLLRTIALFRMWDQVRNTTTTEEDGPVIDEIRQQLKLALSETVFHKSIKAMAVKEVASLFHAEENQQSEDNTG